MAPTRILTMILVGRQRPFSLVTVRSRNLDLAQEVGFSTSHFTALIFNLPVLTSVVMILCRSSH